jgi:hypothetical protein
MKRYEETNKDWLAVNGYLLGLEKKAMAAKYNTSTKLGDMKNAIIEKASEIRRNSTEFTEEDVQWFRRLNVSDIYKKACIVFEKESKSFLEYLKNYELDYLKSKHLEKKIGHTSASEYKYWMSAQERFYIMRYENVTKYLDSEKKSPVVSNIFNFIIENTKDFHNGLIENAKKGASFTYDMFVGTIEKFDGKEDLTKNEKARLIQAKYLTEKYNKDSYIEAMVARAENDFNYSMNEIATRISNNHINTENLEVVGIANSGKLFDLMFKSSTSIIDCRAIWVTGYENKIDFYRYVITEKKN